MGKPEPKPESSEACRSTKELRAWLDGRAELSPRAIEHLESCERCGGLLASLSDDEQLRLLAASARRGSGDAARTYLAEPEFEQLRKNVATWPPASVVALPPKVSPPSPPAKAPDERSTLASDRQTTRRLDRVPGAFPSEVVSSAYARHGAENFANEPYLAEKEAALTIEMLSARLPAGRFYVEELLAVGGSGAVYRAFDKQLAREVAIKLLDRDSFRDRQRFIREARMLAELEHPNVVRVFEFGSLATDSLAGESAGQLYLIMEYMPGGTARQLGTDQPAWTDQRPQAHGLPAMSFQRLAELLASAADGLSAAHANGLVHRDVKPSNLLLTADWTTAKVADFGLARLADIDATQVTRTGEVLGTPAFMSPEQVTAHSELTASTDIYSLGAALYQLATGLPPYQGRPAAVLRQVVEGSPVAARLINPALPQELETICAHAMEREPTARYATMHELAADLRRFASGEPIHARPVSTTAKALRFLMRNRSFASALVICVLLAAALTVGSAVAATVFHQQNRELERIAENERLATQSAVTALKASMEAADELLLAVTTETEFLPRTPGSQAVTRKLLERARDYFREFLDANEGNAELTYQLARAHAGLGEVAMRVGDMTALEAETMAALELIENIPADQIDPVERAILKADTLVVLANYLTGAGEAKRAIPLLREAIAECEVGLSTSSPTEELMASHATALLGLANALTWLGSLEAAIPLLTESRDMFGRLRETNPENPSYVRSAAACDITLATSALDRDEASVGKQHLLDAMQLLEQVGDDDAISLRIRELKTKVLINLALAERKMGNNLAAKAGYEAAIVESRRLIELEPSVPSHQWNLVVAALNSGGPDIELGNLEPLVERWQNTLPVLDDLIDREPDNQRYQQVQAMLQSNIAILLRDMGKLEAAIEPLQAATTILLQQAEQLDKSPEAYLPVSLNYLELASTFIQLERWKEAEVALDACDRIVVEILQSDQSFTPARGHLLDSKFARFNLLRSVEQADSELCLSVARQSVELARELVDENPEVAEYRMELPQALVNHASILLDVERFDDALQSAREAESLFADFPTDDEDSDRQNARKKGVLIEGSAVLGLHRSSGNDGPPPELDAIVIRAVELGASDAEIAQLFGAEKGAVGEP